MINAIRLGFSGAFSRYNLLSWSVLIPLLSVAGPFGTFTHHTFPERLGFWSGVVVLSSIVVSICVSVSRKVMDRDKPLLQDLAIVILTTMLFTPILLGLVALFFGGVVATQLGVARAGAGVGFVMVAVCLARRILPGIEAVSYRWTRLEPARPRLMQRLPSDETGPVLRLFARDHAVEVITETGAHTLRMRMGDAIAEMEPVEGYATHRSHWVARAAVAGHAREGAKAYILLSNGDRVPVSRTYRQTLEDAGLL